MASPSAFQTLPLHIAEKIASYCFYSKLEFDFMMDAHTKREHIWSIFYNVSSYWRELALKYFFSEVNIGIFFKYGLSRLEYPHLPNKVIVDKDYSSYVKRVNVKFNSIPILQSGRICTNVSLDWPVDLVLASVRHLFVEIIGFQDQPHSENILFEKKRVQWLARRIPTAMPKLEKVTLGVFKPRLPVYELSFDYTLKMDDCLSAVFEKMSSFTLSEGEAFLPRGNQPMQNNVELTKVLCSLLAQDNLFVHVIRKSASTLESLSISDSLLLNTRSLIYDEENQPIVYPRLIEISFSSGNNPATSEKISVDENVVLFPALRSLWWSSRYVFDDDTLFRGNSNTLEYLNIRTDFDIIDILQRHKTFADGKYGRLSHVSAHGFIDDDGAESDLEMLKRFGVSFITPATAVFSLQRAGLHGIDTILAETRYLENIKVLRLLGYDGTLDELITLVKLLPNMSTLESGPGITDFESDSTQFIAFIDGLSKESYPLSNRFIRWEFTEENPNTKRLAAETALTFAILCTNFTRAYIPLGSRIDFDKKIKKFIASGPHVKHADKLPGLIQIKS